MRPISTSQRDHAAIWATFVLLTLAHTFPMWLSPATVLNELWDVRLNTWILAWDAHAFLTDPRTIFDANIFHPHANALAFSENLLGIAVLVAPLNWLGEPVLAYNAALLLAFALTGIATAYWVRELTGRTDAGLVAGLAWTFAPVRFDHLPQIQLLTAQWAPLALLALAAWARTRKPRHLFAATLLLAWQYAAGVQLTLLLMPLVAIVALHLVVPHLRVILTRRILAQLAAAAILFVGLTAPISLPYVEARDAEGFVRRLEDTRAYSARPVSLLSPSGIQRAEHMQSLYQRYWGWEANFFPGVLVLALALWGTGASLSRVVRDEAAARRSVEARPGPLRRARRTALGGAIALTSVGLIDYATTLALAFWWERPAWATRMLELLAATNPATLLFLGLGALLLLWVPRPDTPTWASWGTLLMAGSVLCFLLAAGPYPTAWNSEIGLGPFRLLYEAAMPYQSIRAVGRFGLPAVMALSVVAGIGYLRLADRLGSRPRLRTALLAAVIAMAFLEVRVLPFPTADAQGADEELYARLADLPGQGAVVHVPIKPNDFAPDVTEYMMGSVRHWRPLVNGYSGFTPPDILQLGTVPPLEDEFFADLRRDFAVEWIAVHGQHLEKFTALEPELLERPDLEQVDRWGDTFLFRFRPLAERGGVVSRRVAAWQLEGNEPLRFRIRRSPSEPAARKVDLRANGVLVAELELSSRFEEMAVEMPAIPPSPDGTVTLVWRGDPEQTPDIELGTTGATLRTDVLVDAQGTWVGIAVDDAFVDRTFDPGALLLTLEDEGRGVRTVRRFDHDDRGLRGLRAAVEKLPPGTVVAIAMRATEQDAFVGRDVEAALALVGGAGALLPGEFHRAAILGARGASPGGALQAFGGGRAVVRGGPLVDDYPRFVLDALRLPYQQAR